MYSAVWRTDAHPLPYAIGVLLCTAAKMRGAHASRATRAHNLKRSNICAATRLTSWCVLRLNYTNSSLESVLSITTRDGGPYIHLRRIISEIFSMPCIYLLRTMGFPIDSSGVGVPIGRSTDGISHSRLGLCAIAPDYAVRWSAYVISGSILPLAKCSSSQRALSNIY